MYTKWETVWQFHTRNLNVALQTTDEIMHPADSFEFQEDIQAVLDGRVTWFVARVLVSFRDGTTLGNDVLGGCAYNSVQEFYTSHRDPDPMNRNSSIMRTKRGENTVMCHYFPEMVRIACAEARKRLAALNTIHVR